MASVESTPKYCLLCGKELPHGGFSASVFDVYLYPVCESCQDRCSRDPHGVVAEYPQLFELDFGHSPRNQIAGKWQPDEGLIAGAWEAESFRDVYLPSRLHLISGRRPPALALSAKDRFLNGQSRVMQNSIIGSV